jgi:ABC-type polysaccharide/polyol phosphate transport system ATPase subunit
MSSDQSIVTVRDLSKVFRLGVGRARVREMLPWPLDRAAQSLFPRWWARDTFQALENVLLTVPRGSAVGIVGHNGAGKTTLLKLIASIMAPTSGEIAVSGRIGALVDVLTGAHPELTGRENALLIGSIYGLGRRKMESRIDEILEFAEVTEFADTPLKRYSAGMGARLGFATLTALDVDILLVDEVLAVGDSAFQQKCIRWLDDFREKGGTLLFVSHNMALVRHMTDRAVWLDHGRVAGDGPTGSILVDYAKSMERRDTSAPTHQKREVRRMMRATGMHRWGAGGIRVGEVRIEDPSENGAGLEVAISYEASELERAIFCVGFVDETGREIGAAASPAIPLTTGKGEVTCEIRPVPLRDGIYFPVVGILSTDGQIRDRWRLDRAVVVDKDGQLQIGDSFGAVDIEATWDEGSVTESR